MGLDIIIDADRIRKNAERIRAAAADKRLTLMVKADGYNHGAKIVATLTKEYADCFGVATLSEAKELTAAGITLPVTVFSPFPREMPEIVNSGYVPVVHSAECLENLKNAVGATVDIKIDTTMNRLGFRGMAAVKDAARAARELGLNIRSLLTHIPDPARAQKSISLFNVYKGIFEETFGKRLPGEYAASDGIIRCLGGDGYRIGRLLYSGAMNVYGTVLAKGYLKKGESAGYNGIYTAPFDTVTAIVSGGYYDGVRRDYHGAKLHFKGNTMTIAAVCMDVTIVAEVPPELKVGDTVRLFDGNSEMGVGDANIYETMTSFKGRTRRKYLSNGQIHTEEDYIRTLFETL